MCVFITAWLDSADLCCTCNFVFFVIARIDGHCLSLVDCYYANKYSLYLFQTARCVKITPGPSHWTRIIFSRNDLTADRDETEEDINLSIVVFVLLCISTGTLRVSRCYPRAVSDRISPNKFSVQPWVAWQTDKHTHKHKPARTDRCGKPIPRRPKRIL